MTMLTDAQKTTFNATCDSWIYIISVLSLTVNAKLADRHVKFHASIHTAIKQS